LLRMVQGASVGGQIVGAFLYTVESVPENRACFMGAVCYSTATLGTFFGSVVVSILRASMSESQMVDFGWRIPFLSSFVVGIIGYLLQRKSHESPIYEILLLRRNLLIIH